MRWDPTDQFGNLFIGESAATTLDELAPEIMSMISELRSRTDGPITVSVDVEYGDINGPDPDQVSHVLKAPFLCTLGLPDADVLAKVQSLADAACKELDMGNVTVAKAE